MIKLFTSYFGRFRFEEEVQEFGVTITSYCPYWWEGKHYEKLSPPWILVQELKEGLITEEEYEEEYNKILAELDPKEVAEELGNGAIMICYCGKDKFCHRHLVAKWLQEAEISCIELTTADEYFKEMKE